MARLAHDTGIQGLDRQMTEYVCTRWYRAPELLCCWSAYSYEVDVWSTGCVLAEMMTRKCLFKGKSTVDQLLRIEAALGVPSEDEIAKIPNAKARTYLQERKPFDPPALEKVLGVELRPMEVDLLANCILKFDPAKRQSIQQLLKHEYVEDLHDEADEPTSTLVPLEDFEFERRQVGSEELMEEMFKEILEYHPEAKANFKSTYDVRNVPLNSGQEAEENPGVDDERLPDSDEEDSQNPTMQQRFEL
jgi:mitogen-activated protein kinase 1/3